MTYSSYDTFIDKVLFSFLQHLIELLIEPFPKQQILDSFKLKEFADDNFKFDENGRNFSKWVENTAIFPLSTTFSKDVYVKARACL